MRGKPFYFSMAATLLSVSMLTAVPNGAAQAVFPTAADQTVELRPGTHIRYIDRLVLPQYAVKFYEALEEGADNDGKGDALIDPDQGTLVSTTMGGSYFNAQCIPVSIDPEENTDDAIQCLTAAYAAFEWDHPEVFWLSDNPMFSTGRTSAEVYLILDNGSDIDIRLQEYRSTEEIRADIQTMNEVVAAIEAEAGTTNHEKIQYFNSWLTKNNEFNTSTFPDEPSIISKRSISAFFGKTGAEGPVGGGYACAFKVLCDNAGIPCVLVNGVVQNPVTLEDTDHIWNYVQLEDKWYAVDVAWNDLMVPGAESHDGNEAYLLVGADTVIDGVKFFTSHPVSNSNGPDLNATCFKPRQTVRFPDVVNSSVAVRYGTNTVVTQTAHTVPEGGTVIYSSSNPSVAVVSEDGTVAILKAGTAIISARAIETDTHAEDTASYTLEVTPKEITAAAEVTTKVYDGNRDAIVTISVAADDLVQDDTVIITGMTGIFDSGDIGADKIVALNSAEVVIQGKNADCYQITLPTEAVGEIIHRPLSITGGTVADKIYDGTDVATVTNMTFDGIAEGEQLVFGTDYTVIDARFDSADAGTNKAVLTTVELHKDGPTAKNYKLSADLYSIPGQRILSAPAIGAAEVENATLSYGEALIVRVTGIQLNTDEVRSVANPGTNRVGLYWGDHLLVAAEVSGGAAVLTYDTRGKIIPVGSHSLTVAYGGNGNLAANEALATVAVTLHPKALSGGIRTNDSSASRVYDGTTVFSEVLLDLWTVETGDLVSASGTGTVSAANVGSYPLESPTVELTGRDGQWYSTPDVVSGTVEITKAEAPAAMAGVLHVRNRQEARYFYDLHQLLPAVGAGKQLGRIEFELETISGDLYTEAPEIQDGILNVLLKYLDSDLEDSHAGVVSIRIISQNYGDMTAVLTIATGNKTIPVGAPTLSRTTLTFGETLSAITLTGKMGDVAGQFAWKDGSIQPPAGLYSGAWLFTPDDPQQYAAAEGSTTVTVIMPVLPPPPVIDSGGAGTDDSIQTAENTSNDRGAAATQIQPTVNGTTASAQVSAQTMTEAIEKAIQAAGTTSGGASVELKVDAPEKVMVVNLTLPVATLSEVAESDVETLVISSPVGQMRLGSDTLRAIAKAAGGDSTTISMAQVDKATVLSAVQLETVGTAPVFDFSIYSGDRPISSFDGSAITIALPYQMGEGEQPDGVTVYYIEQQGGLQAMESSYNSETQTILFQTPHLSLYMIGYDAATAWENPFSDVQQSYGAFDAVRYSVRKGLLIGTGAQTFSPDRPMTRAEVATALWRSAGAPAVSVQTNYADVPAGAWYGEALSWAEQQGIILGVGNRRAAPEAVLTREQLATILHRYAGRATLEETSLSGVADSEGVSPWAREGMAWAVSNEILTVNEGHLLAPGASTPRAEVAAILQRYFERKSAQASF